MTNKPYEIPTEVRDFAEKSVDQARKAVSGFLDAAQKAILDTIEDAVAVAVMLCTPGERALEVTDQTPPAEAKAVPTSVAPS